MKFKIQIVTVSDDGQEENREIASLERDDLQPETLGLTLAESKAILKDIQEIVVERQATDFLASQRRCPDCDQLRHIKGYHSLSMRTVFGKLKVKSPRLYHCDCRPQLTRTFSPLTELLPEHTTPELLFLETKWAALVSYGLAAKLLEDVLPMDEPLNAFTIRQHVFEVAERMENVLGEEKVSFIESCQRDRNSLPIPDGPLAVGIDGGFIRAQHKEGHFEVIVGKSILSFRREQEVEEESSKCFAFVQTFDTKPKRRLSELLKSQGMQENQQIVFLSDGGEDVRNLQLYLSPEAEHLLDWFHLSMRLTVLNQTAKGLPIKVGEGEEEHELREDVLKLIESSKWYLWHGNVFQALKQLEFIEMDMESAIFQSRSETPRKLLQAVKEFHTYIDRNRAFIPNYGERYRNGERISTGFVESAVNQVMSKRMAKKQQMQWSRRGAHLLLQVRTQVLNEEWEETFRAWYPGFRQQAQSAAA
jgi:hypothetical protein